jgi:isoamylase
MVDVHVEQSPERTVIRLSGRLVGVLPSQLQADVLGRFRTGERVILDLSATEGLTGFSLRQLLLLARHARSVGCHLVTEGVPAELRYVVEAAGFLPLFEQLRSGEEFPSLPSTIVPRIDAYPTRTISGYGVCRGEALPFGATLVPMGVNFSIFARHAESCTLLVYEQGEDEPLVELPFPSEFRIGDVYAMTVFNLDIDAIEYAFRLTGPFQPERGHRYDPKAAVLDPYARSLSGGELWGERRTDGTRRFRGRIVPHDFDWGHDRPLQIPVDDLIIYEMHVRGFTQSSTSGVMFPGTFAGLREKIPYLQSLGINCVELMPVFEFNECEVDRVHPETSEPLVNFWGYSTVGFNSPKAGFAATGALGMQVDEFKTLVRELHAAGIEVILDVVFNHTAEGNEAGPTLSFRGLDNSVYYMLTPEGAYQNFSGCGNTLNCNHPVVRDFVRTSLRHWVTEYHIDGFRFDLASILGRDSEGAPLRNPPLLESLARDPILSRTKLIAEAWDAGGLYQVGTFPSYGRWMEWNGRFRDCVRKFLRGDPGQAGEMAQRLIGSPDMYASRGPTASVNFVTCHDGFTLADLVSYNTKHNLANAEDNRDGTDDNCSWNCGVEGPTENLEVLALRQKQRRNALTMLFLSQGVPMVLMGDEIGKTQFGNNNAYCHDSPLTWFDWTQCESETDWLRFCRELIAFRRRHPSLSHALHPGRRPNANDDLLDVSWHGVQPWQPDWGHNSHSLAMLLKLYSVHGLLDTIYAIFNMYWEPLVFQIPEAPNGWGWRMAIDTSQPSPRDIFTPGTEPPIPGNNRVTVAARSSLVLVASEAPLPQVAVKRDGSSRTEGPGSSLAGNR